MISIALRIAVLSTVACILTSSAVIDYQHVDELSGSQTISYVLLSAEAEQALGFKLDVSATQFMNYLETINNIAKQGKAVCKYDFILWTSVSHALQMSMADGKGNYFDDNDTFVRVGDFDEESGNCVLKGEEHEEVEEDFLHSTSRTAGGGDEIVVNLQQLDCRSHKKSLCRDYCCEPQDEDAIVFCNEEVQCWSQT